MTEKIAEDMRSSEEGKLEEGTASSDSPAGHDVEAARPEPAATKDATAIDWDTDPQNPLNWPARKKLLMVAMISSSAILA